METGIEIIAKKRAAQIDKHGFTTAYDAAFYQGNSQHDLVFAAAAYALPSQLKTTWQKENLRDRSNLWPWGKNMWNPTPDNRIEELANAGALIAAEIDRLQILKEKEL